MIVKLVLIHSEDLPEEKRKVDFIYRLARGLFDNHRSQTLGPGCLSLDIWDGDAERDHDRV